MKKIFASLFLSTTFFALLLVGSIAQPDLNYLSNEVIAQEDSTSGATIRIDLGQEAQDRNLPGVGTTKVGEEGAYSAAFGQWLGSLMSFIMAIAAILVLLYLIWGAMEWITAGGDSSKIQKARDKITQSIIGIIVLASTVALFILIQNFLGICILNFGGSCRNSTTPTQQTTINNSPIIPLSPRYVPPPSPDAPNIDQLVINNLSQSYSLTYFYNT